MYKGIFSYTNVDYPVLPAVAGVCPDYYAYDALRNRCVSKRGWCEGRHHTCEGKPELNHHPQFVCDPQRDRADRCCREWWPPEEGITPAEAKGEGRCWKYKATDITYEPYEP